MHILQAERGLHQLRRSDTSVSVCEDRDDPSTYKLCSVHFLVLLYEFVNIPIIHPLGNHRVLVGFEIDVNTEQRKNIRVF